MSAIDTQKPKQVGRILVESGLLTEEQLNEALSSQKQGEHRKLLGETIIELGFCSEEQVVESLAKAYGIPFARLTTAMADPSTIDALPNELIEKHCVIPLFRVDNVLTVAMAEPSNLFLIEELQQEAGCAVQVVAATQADIQKVLQASMPDPNVVVIDDLFDDYDGLDQSAPVFDVADLDQGSEGAPVIKLANYVIFNAVREGASDIHIEPDENQLRIRYRIDGRLVEKLKPPLPLAAPLVSRLKIMASLDISERRLPQDGAIHVKMKGHPIDLRVSTLPNQFGEKVVLRILDTRNTLVRLEQLGFDKDTLEGFRHGVRQPQGMMLVTGPTGSGKSTTLYASLLEINSQEINICTVEDPIEFNLVGVNQFQVNEKIGYTLAGTLRSLLRQDPDVIMVGEIRDVETAKVAVQASLTGHMVFSTLHTNDAPSAVTRLYNVGVEPYLISASLTGVLAQRLVRRLCPACREKVEPSAGALKWLEKRDHQLEHVYQPSGCSQCRRKGYLGRTGVYEMFVPDDVIRDAITGKATLDQLRALAKQKGMRTLLEDGLSKAAQGVTTLDEILRVTIT